MFIWQRIGGNSRRDELKTENSPQKDGNNTRQTRRAECVCWGGVNWISWARKQRRDAPRWCQRSERTEGGLKRRIASDLTVLTGFISLVRNVSCFATVSHFFGWSDILRTAGISCKSRLHLKYLPECIKWLWSLRLVGNQWNVSEMERIRAIKYSERTSLFKLLGSIS